MNQLKIDWGNRMYRIWTCQLILYFLLLNVTEGIEENYVEIKSMPSVLHNQNVYLPVLYRCTSVTKQRIRLSIDIEHVFYRRNLIVFHRHWYCQATVNVQILNIHVRLHRAIAYADDQIDLRSWPVETGRLNIVMFDGEQENEERIVKQVRYEVRFLPVHKRPKRRSIRWNPLMYKTENEFCLREPEILRIVDYPLVLTGGNYGKHLIFPSFVDYTLRWEKQIALTRAKFSIVFWLYITEYCIHPSPTALCGILQHLTYNMTHLTPELFINREGQFVVHAFGYLYDLIGESSRTFASIPKNDWCRVVFVVNEDIWRVYINCLKTWEKNITAVYKSPFSFYYADEVGTFIVGGSDSRPSFRGFLGQMDFYRRIALKPEEFPKKLQVSIPAILPMMISESNQCLHHLSTFAQCREQFDLLNRRIREKNTCPTFSFRLTKSNPQSLLIRSWKQQSQSIRYRIFRALHQRTINSAKDVAEKLFQLIDKHLENDELESSCVDVLRWLEQAVCYSHPAAHSLLAIVYKYGLCGRAVSSTRVLELLFNGAFLKDRLSLLALGHRHFYGLEGVPQDYDAAYVYYREMADISKFEFYNPKPGEVPLSLSNLPSLDQIHLIFWVVMEYIRLTDDKLINGLTFDHSEIFYWLREQARRGVLSAQQRLGWLMYAGRNGLTRNVQQAVEYFRLAADQHNSPALFMYGLALLKGEGVAQNITEGIRHLEKAAEYGHYDALIALGHHAYNIERNDIKAAKYWQDCYDRNWNIYCAHNLGVMWSAGRYPLDYKKDPEKAWKYFSYAAQRGQIDSKIVVAYYNAFGGHPLVQRNPRLSAIWSRMVADESSAVGSIVRRALRAYQDRRWRTALIFYLQAALAGAEVGYFNAGFLCYELQVGENAGVASIDCIEQLLEISLMMRDANLQNESYDLLIVAEYYQLKKNDLNRTIELYLRLFQNGDPRGLFNLAQLEENDQFVPFNIWEKVGMKFEEEIITEKYRRLQAIYQYCRSLTIPRQDESYLPCTLSYFKMSTIIFINEFFEILITIIALIIAIYFVL